MGDTFDEFVRHAVRHGRMSSGHHHRNYRVRLTDAMAARVGREPGTQVVVRIPVPDALPVVVRTWRDESRILHAVRRSLVGIPEPLAARDGVAVHTFVEGSVLSRRCAGDSRVDADAVRALADVLARTVVVDRAGLPPLPDRWTEDGQSFLRALAHRTDAQVRRPNLAEFGELFRRLGVAEDAMAHYAERIPSMSLRPFGLLHTDLHRDNVIVSDGPDASLVQVDWELATYGDPLHELATHVVRMRYPDDQVDEVTEAWAGAVDEVRPGASKGLESDLPHFLDFERGQSVYPDVMRAARSLGVQGAVVAQEDLDRAVAAVARALDAARRPLELPEGPDEETIRDLLLWWHGNRRAPGTLTSSAP
ncbi:phosphotransferase [Streptomyces sp. NPDC059909]|uniref:phosphotransferase n=1 Tax=Streptomyces sp. NPDC059909 TaxID=3346998 RepID=UPI00364753EB